MVKAWVLSDLHCDHGTVPPPIPAEADIAILAGDIMNDDWVKYVASKLVTVFVAGNHEFYGYSQDERMNHLKSFHKDHVAVLENDMLITCGPDIAGATLWTNYDNGNPLAMEKARRGLNDHIHIKQGAGRFLPEHALALHNESIDFLRSSNADVIVTHHAPHSGSIHPRYKGQLLNYAFVSEVLETFDNPPRLWVHGHVHDCFDYVVGKTRVICNPHGYPGENRAFNPALLVDI